MVVDILNISILVCYISNCHSLKACHLSARLKKQVRKYQPKKDVSYDTPNKIVFCVAKSDHGY